MHTDKRLRFICGRFIFYDKQSTHLRIRVIFAGLTAISTAVPCAGVMICCERIKNVTCFRLAGEESYPNSFRYVPRRSVELVKCLKMRFQVHSRFTIDNWLVTGRPIVDNGSGF